MRLPKYSSVYFILGTLVFFTFVFYKTSLPSQPSNNNLTISVSTTPLSAPVYIAYHKGFFADQNLDVQLLEHQGGHRALKAMLEGQSQFATSSDIPIMFNSFKKAMFKVVATFVQSENDLKVITSANSGIESISDIRGHRVGVIKGGSSQYFFDTLRLIHQIAQEDVEIVYLAPELLAKALQAKEVDVIVPWEPYGFNAMQLLGNNARVLDFSDEVYRETFNLVADPQLLINNPDQLHRIILALESAIEFIHNSPKEAQEVVMQQLGLEQDFMDWSWKDMNYRLSLSQSLIHTLEAEARWAIENQLVEEASMPNFLQYISSGELYKIKPSYVTVVN